MEDKDEIFNDNDEITFALTDARVVELASTARNKKKFLSLYEEGDISSYSSALKADQALIYLLAFYTKDAEQLLKIFKNSALFKKHLHPMLENKDYLPAIIESILQKVTTSYMPRRLKNKSWFKGRQK